MCMVPWFRRRAGIWGECGFWLVLAGSVKSSSRQLSGEDGRCSDECNTQQSVLLCDG